MFSAVIFFKKRSASYGQCLKQLQCVFQNGQNEDKVICGICPSIMVLNKYFCNCFSVYSAIIM
jgi:hypothetical protein